MINFVELINRNNMKHYKVVSLFSGCGGLDLGFTGGFSVKEMNYTKTPFKIILSNDFDSATELVYNANEHFFHHKMTMCDVKHIADESIPEFDILLAGFPCQPFSNAGLRKGVDDYRGTLYKECERFLTVANKRKKKPIAFVFENVKGILSSKVANGLTVPDEIVRLTKELGYTTVYKLINASHYGVPSNRQRVIMVGVRDDIAPFNFDLIDYIARYYKLPSALTNPYKLTVGYTLANISAEIPQSEDYWEYSPGGQSMIEKIGGCYGSDEIVEMFPEHTSLDAFPEEIKVGRSWKNIDPDDMPPRFRKIHDDPKRYHAPNYYRRFALGEINGTITASAQPENCGITHPFKNRRYTIREIARIQSFPDNFVFPYKSKQDAYKVIGNAVPPVMGWVIAKALAKHLKDNTNE